MFGGKNDGPTIVPAHTRTVPERRTCDGCRYFASHRTGNVCGGFGGRLGPRVTECRHPDAMLYYDNRFAPGEQIPLRTSDRGMPRPISMDSFGFDGTPEWCPYLKKEGAT